MHSTGIPPPPPSPSLGVQGEPFLPPPPLSCRLKRKLILPIDFPLPPPYRKAAHATVDAKYIFCDTVFNQDAVTMQQYTVVH